MKRTDPFIQTLFDIADVLDFTTDVYPRLNRIKLEDDLIELELPGVSKDKISISIEGTTLVITGEDRSGTKFRKAKAYTREFNLEDIDAAMANGLLSIKVPIKKEAVKSAEKRDIKIKGV